MEQQTVRVWDIAVRLFHWSLVVFFTVAYLSGEENSTLHVYSGYAVAGLVLFRILWGFVGSRHARFSDFLYPPRKVVYYLESLTSRKPQHCLGHTPPGGWMIMLLLGSLLVTSVTGLQAYGIEGYGPLAGNQSAVSVISAAYAEPENDDEHESEEELWEDIHEFFANFTLFLVFVHIAGVVVSSRLHNENLVRAMLTGNKEVAETDG